MSGTNAEALSGEWLRESQAALEALTRGRVAAALAHSHAALDGLDETDRGDARLAAAKNNLGAALLLTGRNVEAWAALGEALDLWRDAREHAEAMDVPVAGRSSAFHLQLAMDHQDAFREAALRRYLKQCDAAREITRLNALMSQGRAIARKDLEETIEAITAGFGPRAPEIAVLQQLADGSAVIPPGASTRTAPQAFAWYGDKLARITGRNPAPDPTALPADAHRLVLAAQLTTLCDPRLIALASAEDAPRSEGT